MTTKLLNWASNEGQITKSKLSGGRRAKFFPWLVVMIYNLLRTEGYLGNVGLKAINEDIDLTEHMRNGVDSLRIVVAAQESIDTGEIVRLN